MAASQDLLVLFDLDGTLIRAGDTVHHDAFDHALRAVFGVSATVRGLPLGGRLDRQLAPEALAAAGVAVDHDDPRVDRVMAVMGRYYRLRVGPGDRADWVLAGVVDLLRKLKAGGTAMGIATGSAREVALAKLEGAHLSGYLTTGAYGDEASDRAALVDRAVHQAGATYGRRFLRPNTVVVGDTPADVEAARAVGARVVAVATGRYSTDDLDDAGPDATFPDLTAADLVLRAIRG
jgi:beta-phosphoglucomutase-like phosphatase (HAD superfamily)